MNLPYKIFIPLWAVALLFQLCSCFFLPDQLIAPPTTMMGVIELVLFFCALGLLVRNESIFLLNLCSILIVADNILVAPEVPNHRWLTTFVSLGILISTYVNKNNLKIENILKDLAPYIRFLVFTLYFYAVFQKLNTDFLFSDVSCAKKLYKDINTALVILPNDLSAINFTPYLTVIIEGLFLVLLFFSYTRNIGILAAVCFHFFLTIDPATNYTDFSSTLYPLYVFFLSDDFLDKCKRNLPNTFLSLIENKLLIAVCFLGFLIIFYIMFASYLSNNWSKLDQPRMIFWILYFISILSFYIISISGKWFDNKIQEFRLFPRIKALQILAIFYFINGTLPYLGIKTRTSFDMYSNLRVEYGISNHLIIRKPLDLLGNTSKIVKILDSSDDFLKSEYRDKNYSMTYFEFWRYLSKHQDISVKYEINNEPFYIPKVSENSEFSKTPSIFLQKALWYRPVDEQTPVRCQW